VTPNTVFPGTSLPKLQHSESQMSVDIYGRLRNFNEKNPPNRNHDTPGIDNWITLIEGRVADLADEIRRFKEQTKTGMFMSVLYFLII
jgi:hypothetical protein